MKRDFLFTSESVTEGHPDKLCDQISDAIVDAFLMQDPYSSVIAECAASTGVMFVATRFASQARVDVAEVARRIAHQVGYDQGSFRARDATVMTTFQELTPSLYSQRDEKTLNDAELEQLSARHPATVFGYACNHTSNLMPLPVSLAHRLTRRLSAVRFEKLLPYLAPDGQSQVGVEFHNRRPVRIHSISLVASQRAADAVDPVQLRADLIEQVITPAFRDEAVRPDADTNIWINPYGPVIEGGPALHAGLTGRKNAVDTYGEYSRHSGSALSGKDPSRIDRIGAYAARYAAKNIVAAGLAEECEVQLSYAIGLSRPVSVQVETLGTGRIDDDEIRRRLEAHCDFRVGAIISRFNLRHLPAQVKGGFYRKLGAYGHVGRTDIGLPWEQTDLVAAIR
ncbi:MAG: methionine adenosyltransferase [Gammaproteobacteria bacterium]|nr:methionine adenosyltransferase [Gammaproteobacteria bacterium]